MFFDPAGLEAVLGHALGEQRVVLAPGGIRLRKREPRDEREAEGTEQNTRGLNHGLSSGACRWREAPDGRPTS
jgi:hypothetical protein